MTPRASPSRPTGGTPNRTEARFTAPSLLRPDGTDRPRHKAQGGVIRRYPSRDGNAADKRLAVLVLVHAANAA